MEGAQFLLVNHYDIIAYFLRLKILLLALFFFNMIQLIFLLFVYTDSIHAKRYKIPKYPGKT